MRTITCIGVAVFLIGCGDSDLPVGEDAGYDAGPADMPVAPETNRSDSNPAVGEDAGYDAGPAEAPVAVDTNRNDSNPRDGSEAGCDVGYDAGYDAGCDVGYDTGRSDVADGNSVSEAGDQCVCAEGSSPSLVSWNCFCSVESCTRTLADFVGAADGGKTVKNGWGTVLVMEYASCNLALVVAKTYSNYVPASEYVFDLTTGALLGAKVWLDDRQHSCPFPTDVARWVFGYQSGSYPIPSSCQATDCLPGSGTCP